jgi:superfamily I DNA/RNA helicase/CRISPR/Cas system-associated exonuclease Cas4 (RecB family)
VSEERRIGPAEWPEAIEATDGPQLVVAGPGTGKTEFLVQRAVHLIRSGRARSDQILVLSFSRRAATDLRNRIAAGVEGSWTGIAASTFHSFAFRLLEAHSERALGWPSMPSLLTGPEQVALVHHLLLEEDSEDWPSDLGAFLGTQTLAVELSDLIMRTRELLLDGTALAAMGVPEWQAIPSFLQAYDRRLEAEGRIDYGTLLLRAAQCLESGVAAEAEEQYPYVLVDEFQDTTVVQARMLDLLTASRRNLTVAADPYQSIYGFRGAAIDNVISFVERFGGGREPRRWVLAESFRVPAPILESALRVVAGGALPGGAGVVLPAGHGGQVGAYVFDQATAEAEWIATEVERMHLEEAVPYSAMAVLVRSKRHLLPELSRALDRRNIPHDPPDSRLADHPAVRMVLDLVTAATDTDPEEVDRAVRRLLLGPLFALSLSQEREIWRMRRRTDRDWPQLLRETLPEGSALAGLIEDPAWAGQEAAADGFWKVWSRLPQFGRVVHEPGFEEHRAALASLAQSLTQQSERDPRVTLRDYGRMAAEEDFEATPLLSFRAHQPHLTLTTLHQAKGLEFDTVFIADAIEGLFPDNRRTQALIRLELLTRRDDDPEGRRARLQEEMRLAYTAMTRARRRVVWSATSAGLDETENRPSRFLLAAAGVSQVDELVSPPAEATRPLTAAAAQAFLRRTLTDAAAPAPARVAALAALSHPPAGDWWEPRRFPGVAERGPDHGVISLPIVLSPSQADSYESCPRRYVLEKRLGLQGGDSPYAQFGRLIHTVLERAESAARVSGLPHAQLETALAKLAEVWAKEADFGSPVLTEAWEMRGAKLLTILYEAWPPPEGTELLAVEKSLEWTLDEIKWWGRADRIERLPTGGLRVIDYKTTTSPPTTGEAAESLQLGFYLCAVADDPEMAAWGEPEAAQMWFPLGGKRPAVRDFEVAKLEGVGHRLLEVERGIKAEEWPARPSKDCGRCSVKLVCPAWPEGREAYLP